ncbi:glycoside hydrolase family 3 C-terminal domain-containing protein [Paenibacillus sp. SC116]|uniref:glycoside hydrolase family 3 N-terminal domain-containing protein n=1 Tax=Paenibacillus sp. SC116 TaxID=2968986 RepID=UPI00215A4D42|nr:glycoside hydrolase family 3 N-terminal domain-containing protein [Paenibacillus sp. SC116]MCR8845383.1 glycoside hydrolase family 3 C-terminal domain-containing protein [Paenibacillus sp. SC116]
MVNQQRMVDLLKQMTLEEKIAQLLQLAAPFYDGNDSDGVITGPMKELGITEETVRQAGSALGLAGADKIKHIQQEHLKNNRLGIPLLFMADIIHGFKTIFPIPLAIGCSWDLTLAERSAEVAAKEAAVSGVHVTFAPMVDLVRDPRWGRVMESTGEDPYLNSMFARAFVRGFQGDDLTNDLHRVAACVKHFAAYGLAEGGRDYNTVDLSERQLREYYLPAYKAALDEGCEMVMTSFNTVDGIPATANSKLMRDLLRDEWGFDGVLISDWAAIKELIPHGVAENEKEAAYKSIHAGVDIEMMTSTYVHHLPELIASGKVDEALVDEAVLRVLQLKEKLGLFDNPLRGADPTIEREVVFCEEHRKVSREMAAKSCVLLKNEGDVLPLQPSSRIALIGPFAKNNDILGNWSWTGSKEDAVRLDQALSTKIPDSIVAIAEGSGIEMMSEEQYSEALLAAEQADIIVLALGENSDMSGEGGCRADIKLPQAQLELIARLKLLHKPMVAVLFNGRPLDLHGVYDQVDAVLEAWYPGSEGGAAIADILYGDVNPSGRLTMSFPYSVGQVPVYYNHFNTGRPHDPKDVDARYVSRYLDVPNAPLFPFGYGLSYTTFSYGELILSEDTMTEERPLQVEVTVTNMGKQTGEEVVQLYVRDISGDVVRPLKELKNFAKISLEPGESRKVTFTITEEQLRYHHADLQFTSDPGEFAVFVGSNSRDVMERRFHFVR